jgi:hypothetical protein
MQGVSQFPTVPEIGSVISIESDASMDAATAHPGGTWSKGNPDSSRAGVGGSPTTLAFPTPLSLLFHFP